MVPCSPRLAGRAGAGIERHLVGRAIEHGRVGPEDRLRAVAVMDVEIHDGDAVGAMRGLGVAGGDGDIVEEAEAHRAAWARHGGRAGATATKAFRASPDITASTARMAPPAPRSAASKVPGDIEVSASMAHEALVVMRVELAQRLDIGARDGSARSPRAPPPAPARGSAASKTGLASACSTARMRSTRSGWPRGVSWRAKAGWLTRSVVMARPSAAPSTTPGGGAASSGTKKSGASGTDGIGAVGLEIASRLRRPGSVSSIRKLPVKLDRLVEDRGRRSRRGSPACASGASGPRRPGCCWIAAVAMVVRGHSALTPMPPARLAGEAEHDEAHAELGHRIGGVRREPLLLHVERRRQHQDMRVSRPSPDRAARASRPGRCRAH